MAITSSCLPVLSFDYRIWFFVDLIHLWANVKLILVPSRWLWCCISHLWQCTKICWQTWDHLNVLRASYCAFWNGAFCRRNSDNWANAYMQRMITGQLIWGCNEPAYNPSCDIARIRVHQCVMPLCLSTLCDTLCMSHIVDPSRSVESHCFKHFF